MTDVGTAYGAIDIDLTPLGRAVSGARQVLLQLEQTVNRAATGVDTAARQMNNGMERAAEGMRQAERAADPLNQKLKKTSDELDTASRKAEGVGSRLRDAQGRFVGAGQGAERLGDGGKRGASGLGQISDTADKVKGALGSLGITLGAVQLLQFANDARVAANALEDSQASARALAGDQETYNQVIAIATEQQRLYGGSLAENITQMSSLANTARKTGIDIGDLASSAQRLLVIDPTANFEDATVALREAFAGDITSLAERFELPRSELKKLGDEGLSSQEKLALLDEILTDNGATLEAVEARAHTTAQTYRDLGAAAEQAQTKIGDYVSRGLEPAARGATRLITLNGTELRQSLSGVGEELGRGTARLFGFAGGWSAAGQSISQAADEVDGVTEAQAAASDQTRALSEAAKAAAETAEAIQTRQAAATMAATGDITGALQLLRDQTKLTDDEAKQLGKDLEKAASDGAKAFGDAVSSEIGFLAERESAHRDHTSKIADLERDFNVDMAKLTSEYGQATTEEERQAVAARMVVLGNGFTEHKNAEQAAYAEREQAAAEAYAREQAAQLAHLGQMLIDYTIAQAKMAGISDAQISEMTNRLAAQYGVQQSVVGRSYEAMTGSIDEWVANGGKNADQYAADMSRIQETAVATQQEVDRQIKTLTAQAKQDFDDGKISIDEYAERLTKIPAEAEKAASALSAIPTRVDSEVVITTRNVIADVVEDRAERNAVVSRTPTGRGGSAGARAGGGPVAPGRMYDVVEDGPELLHVGGRTLLLMGNQGGTVVPAMAAASAAFGRAASALRSAPSASPTGAALGRGASAGRGGLQFNITITNPVIDNAERLRAMGDLIAQQALDHLEALAEQILLGDSV